MKRMHIIGFSLLLTGMALVALTLGSCGGSGSGSPTAGAVGIVLSDGPSEEFSAIELTIRRIELLGDSERTTIFEGDKTVDLLQLADHGELFSLDEEVPPGTYDKIRLTLADPGGVSLVRSAPDGTILETIHPDMGGNGKLDLNPRGAFEVVPGGTLLVQLDVDAEKSIHIHATGNNRYRFRPVVFVDILGEELPGRLVRMEGWAGPIDEQSGCFPLGAQVSAASLDEGLPSGYCTLVCPGEAAVFDENGEPTTTQAITEGQRLTAIGFLRAMTEDETGDGSRTCRLVLAAEVIELGGSERFRKICGRIDSPPAGTGETFELQPEEATEALTVLLQEQSPIFSRQGERLTFEDLEAGSLVCVDGVEEEDTAGPLYRAALVVLDTAAPDIDGPLAGTVAEILPEAGELVVTTSAGDARVKLGDQTLYLEVGSGVEGMFSSRRSLDDLSIGQAVEIYGDDQDGTFVAQVILWED